MATKIQDLSLEARLKLVEDIWDSVAAEQHRLVLTEDQKAELDLRLREFEADGDTGEPGDVVLEEIRKGL
jgi:putative addiction module component (TIGR02574 family)